MTFQDGEHEETARITEDWVQTVTMDFILAGAETTSTTLKWALLWMALYPDVQWRVQRELDDLAGKGHHIFSLSDRERLPYTEATIMEIQRLSNVAPTGISHATIEDTEFRG